MSGLYRLQGERLSTERKQAEALADLLEIATRTLHSRLYRDGLFPAQWVALRYMDRAEPQQRTASALARFQGLANGPVSRTVRTLLAKGLLKKAVQQPKGRAEILELTEAGRTLLQRDPFREIADALQGLREEERRSLASALEAVMRVGGFGARHEVGP